MLPPSRLPASRPGPPAPRPTSGLAAEIALRLHLAGVRAATRYDLEALRLSHVAPPTLPRGLRQVAARDGDLARVEAQQRYAAMAFTRQQQLAAAHPTAWQNLLAGRYAAPQTSVSPSTETPDHPNTPEAARRRVAWHRAGQQIDALREDQALNNTLGQGIGYGFAAMAAELAPEFVALRVAGGLRWAGATRAAVVATRLAEQASWAGAEGELIGGRTAWQEYKEMSLGKRALTATSRLGFDVVAQGGANWIGSKEETLAGRFRDSWRGINLFESGMAVYGLRPVGIGVGSAFFQFSIKDGFQNPIYGGVSWQAFGAQAAIGTGFGYLGMGAGNLLTKKLAAHLYLYTGVHWGHNLNYPLWLGGYHVFRAGVLSGIGVTEEHLENKAQDRWPVSPSPAR